MDILKMVLMSLGDILVDFSPFFSRIAGLLERKCGKNSTQNLIPNPPNQFLEVPIKVF
ncbi:MAG: hypothetical protein R3Y49_05030 [Rikenellaceae bacterium]